MCPLCPPAGRTPIPPPLRARFAAIESQRAEEAALGERPLEEVMAPLVSERSGVKSERSGVKSEVMAAEMSEVVDRLAEGNEVDLMCFICFCVPVQDTSSLSSVAGGVLVPAHPPPPPHPQMVPHPHPGFLPDPMDVIRGSKPVQLAFGGWLGVWLLGVGGWASAVGSW